MKLQLNKERDFFGKDVIVIRTFEKDGRIRRVADMWDEDTANLIVKAVNCHDDLYEALKDLLRMVRGDSKRPHHSLCYGIDIEAHPDCELCKSIAVERMGEKALKKAEGKDGNV